MVYPSVHCRVRWSPINILQAILICSNKQAMYIAVHTHLYKTTKDWFVMAFSVCECVIGDNTVALGGILAGIMFYICLAIIFVGKIFYLEAL